MRPSSPRSALHLCITFINLQEAYKQLFVILEHTFIPCGLSSKCYQMQENYVHLLFIFINKNMCVVAEEGKGIIKISYLNLFSQESCSWPRAYYHHKWKIFFIRKLGQVIGRQCLWMFAQKDHRISIA